MNRFSKFALFIFGAACFVFVLALITHGHSFVLLEPKGMIALRERSLMLTATLLMLLIVAPVLGLTFFIAWKFRADNKKASYTPDWDHNSILELIWWGIPCLIILVLAAITWQGTHQLDPRQSLNSPNKPLTIQVVSLRWKWLFIYPEQHIATVNFLQFPEHTPINFQITSDAPMNSFWIPQLGGQIYAMSGMTTQLHLMADSTGSYAGSSANLSGKGFAGMKFTAQSTSQADFDQWVSSVKQSSTQLNLASYNLLANPTENNPITYYSSEEPGLYAKVIDKYMMPAPQVHHMGNNGQSMPGMDMQNMNTQ